MLMSLLPRRCCESSHAWCQMCHTVLLLGSESIFLRDELVRAHTCFCLRCVCIGTGVLVAEMCVHWNTCQVNRSVGGSRMVVMHGLAWARVGGGERNGSAAASSRTLHSCLLLPDGKSERDRKQLHLRQNRTPLGGSGMGCSMFLLWHVWDGHPLNT